MTNQPSLRPQSRSLLVVSKREEFTKIIGEVFSADENSKVTNCTETFTAMNGRAVSLMFGHDVVILEADPDDASEVKAIQDLLSKCSGETVFLAMTQSDVSIAKARKLRDIGVDEVLPLSIDGDGLRAAVEQQIQVRQIPTQIIPGGQAALGKVIPVTQARGGVGATTVAVNLACSLAAKRSGLFRKAKGSRVVLLDFDLQFGDANVYLDLEDKGGFQQIIDALEEPDDHFLLSTLQNHPLGFAVLCAPASLVPLQSLQAHIVESMIALLKERYDYIVVDLPRAVVDWVEPVLQQASQIVLVTDTSVPCVRHARRLINFYRAENVQLPIEVVINRENRPLIKSEHVREAEKILETRFRHWLPNKPKHSRDAVNVGRPITDARPRSDLGKALAKVAAAVSADVQTTKRISH